jgi:hypothetical protein
MFGKPGDCRGGVPTECYAAHPSDLGAAFTPVDRCETVRKNTEKRGRWIQNL